MHWPIVPYTLAHRSLLRQLYLEARHTGFAGQHPSEFELLDFDRVTEGEQLLVAMHRDTPTGFVAWWPPGNFVHSLFVAPAWQGQGVGKALLQAALPHLGRPATLKCLQANVPALRFYAAQGWEVAGSGDGDSGPHYLLAFHKKSPTVS